MRRIRHWRGLVLTISALFTALLLLLYSETVLRGSVFLLTKLIEPLSVGEVHGRLAGPFTLSGVQYADQQNHLSLDQLTLDWHPFRLFALTAHITVLHVEGLRFSQLQKSAEDREPAGKFTLPQIGFPVKVMIDDARLDAMALILLDRAKPLTATSLSLQAETRLNTLEIRTLELQSDWLTLAVQGSLRPRQDYQTALELHWSVPQPDGNAWQGNGTLRGNIHKLQLQQQLASPFAATLWLEAEDLLDAPNWNGTVNVPKLHSAQLPFPITPAFTLGGDLIAKGKRDTFTTTTRIAGQVDSVGDIEMNADAAYGNRQIQLTRLLLTRPGDNARLEASGEADLSASPLSYRMQVQWQALTWPLENPVILSDKGSLDGSGEDTAYRFNSDFLLSGAQVPPGQWQLQGHGDKQAVQLSTLEGKLLGGTVSGTASLALETQPSWQVQLQGKALNPGAQWQQWPGALAFSANVKGRQEEQGIAMTLSLPSLTGTLRGRQLSGHSEAEIRNNVISVKNLALQMGSANLQAKGQLSETSVKFDWQLQADDAEDLLPQAKGSLNTSGNLTGSIAAPKLTLQIEGRQLGFATYQCKHVKGDITLDLQPQRSSSVDMQIDQLQLPGFPQQSLSLRGRGSLREHDISLDSRNASQNLRLELTAGYFEGRWAGILRQFLIDDTQLGQWQLEKPTDFAVTARMVNLEEFCLSRETARLCSHAGWERDQRLSTSLRSIRFPLHLLQPYLPERLAITGELDGQALLDLRPGARPRLESDLAIGPGNFALVNSERGDNDLVLNYQGAKINISTPGNVLHGEVILSLTEQDKIVLAVQSSLASGLPAAPLQHPMTGRLTASISDLGFVSSLVTEVKNFQGVLDVDIQIAGTLKSPLLSGYAQLEQGRMEIPRLGLALSEVSLAARGQNSQSMEIRGGARSGGGDLVLNGQLAPTDSGAWGLDLALRGNDFEVARIPEARVRVSPDLKASIIGREIRLEGAIDIPSARLEPPDIGRAVKPSEDVVIISQEEEAVAERWLIYTRIRMTAADTIRFIGYGFDGRIGGDLLLIDEPGSVTRARGQLHVVPGSTYQSFGTKLSTERGELNFADSPVDNPNLDIRASRTIGEVVAGVDIGGTAKNPVLRLYSEPPMDQADILAYLTLGHPMSSTGQGESQALAGAANTAGLIGGNYLAGYIGRQFGLEEARVEADPTTQSPWVVVGTYLSPRLYVRYGVGVYEDAYSIIVRYQLTERWQVQGEGGRNSGADIFYTFERP